MSSTRRNTESRIDPGARGLKPATRVLGSGRRQAELVSALRIDGVGELATSLAHELNQPLSGIVNGVEACARFVRSGKGNSAKLLALLDDVSAEALRAGGS